MHLLAERLDLLEQVLTGVWGVWWQELEALPQQLAASHAEDIAHRQVVESILRQRRVNPILELGTLPNEHHPCARQVALVPQDAGRYPDGRQGAIPLQPVESP